MMRIVSLRLNVFTATSPRSAEPVFFAYPDHAGIDSIVAKIIKNDPLYDFETDDDVGHHFWLHPN